MKKNQVKASVVITSEAGNIKEQHDYSVELSAQNKFDEMERILKSKKYGVSDNFSLPQVGQLKLIVENRYGTFERRCLAIHP